ncbi:MAG: hypothetical protein A2W03_00920 [Candidatus Aminicenantes bacterium RBG_16_63_16]|nr:MAG: hypothetical protein A2W03_00920 [Candidatus Aminicenantes bacterium RBG_16_63_16]
MLAEPGMLIIDVFKRDLNLRGSTTELRAILAGPDRRVIREATIPDDGRAKGSGPGPVQKTRLAAQVKQKGVFILNVTVSQDRYGEEMVWGFATNCPRYLIETARGHKDEKHQEPIVLLGSDRPADVCFLPRRGPLAIELSGLPASATNLEVFDVGGRTLAEIAVAAGGSVRYSVPAHVPRDGAPWRLHLPTRQATIEIDGLTRWDGDDSYPDLCCWTTEPASFFPLLDYRWLLTPYSRVVYARPGKPAEAVFRVRNSGSRAQTVKLAVEFPGESWPVELSAGQVVLGGEQAAEVTVRGKAAIDGKSRLCQIRATPVESPEFTTYSTLEVRPGEASAASPLELPLVLKPYQHENELFGYSPDYPLDNQVYYDPANRPFISTAGGIATWRDGHWTTADLNRAISPTESGGERLPYKLWGTKIAFDRDGGLYVLATAGTQAALLRSTDAGRMFAACAIPGREGQSRAYDIEQFSGHDAASEKGTPPPVARFTLTESDPKLFWRRLNDLELFVPKILDGRLVMAQPVLISRKSLGQSSHSGIPSCLVSRGGKIHLVWAEATEPAENAPGVPTYVVTYDRTTGKLGRPALVGYGAPPNDVHNSPSITMDSQGYLHVLTGTHNKPFQYARSLQPNDASGGWTPAEPVGQDLPQTYIGMACGPDDTLHLVYRLWRYGEPPYPNSHHATLAYSRKRPGQPWEAPRVLVVPPFSEYSVYYHRLTIDRRGRLFLSYDYWSTLWFYRNDHWGKRRSLLTSPDGGTTWRLATGADLTAAGRALVNSSRF